jgi:hypothetical protein
MRHFCSFDAKEPTLLSSCDPGWSQDDELMARSVFQRALQEIETLCISFRRQAFRRCSPM